MEADCLVGFSFGLRGNTGGPVNEKIAQEIMKKTTKGVPLIMQWEIAEYINQKKVITAKIIRKHRTTGEYLDTYEVAVQAYEVMKQNGWKTYLLAAHYDHAFRCAKVMESLGARLSGIITVDDYDILSGQLWTKHSLLFRPYNKLAFLIYKRRGWIADSRPVIF